MNEEMAFSLMEELAGFYCSFDDFYSNGSETVKEVARGELGACMAERAKHRASWHSLLDIFEHPWFERLWVYQEYILGRKIMLLVHHYFKDIKKLDKAVYVLCSVSED